MLLSVAIEWDSFPWRDNSCVCVCVRLVGKTNWIRFNFNLVWSIDWHRALVHELLLFYRPDTIDSGVCSLPGAPHENGHSVCVQCAWLWTWCVRDRNDFYALFGVRAGSPEVHRCTGRTLNAFWLLYPIRNGDGIGKRRRQQFDLSRARTTV